MLIHKPIQDFIPPISTQLRKGYPRAVKREADTLLLPELSHRELVHGFTIDGAESKDLDDGIWIEKTEKGHKIEISIADVSEGVLPLSQLDMEALKRCTSVYFDTHNLPMFPRKLSSDMFSLNHKSTTPTLTLRIQLDNDNNVIEKEVFESLFKNECRYDHDMIADQILYPESENHGQFLSWYNLAWELYNSRMDNGAVDFDESERKIIIDRRHRPRRKTIGSLIVQEMMILANMEIAKLATQEKINIVFRNHMPHMKGREISHYQKASYSSQMKHHSGLALDFYTHFTSPIRRYPDIIVHRNLKQWIRKEEPIYTAEDINHICGHVNMQVAELLFRQKNEVHNNGIKRRYRKIKRKGNSQDSLLNDEGVKKRIGNHAQRDYTLPDEIVEQYLEEIEQESRLDSARLSTFLLSKETRILEKIKEKIFSQGTNGYKKYLNVINSIGNQTRNRQKIQVTEKEDDTLIEIKVVYKKQVIIEEKLLKDENQNRFHFQQNNLRGRVLEQILDYFIQRSKKD